MPARSSFTWAIEADVILEDGTTHRVGPFGPRDLIAAERQFGLPMSLMVQMPRLEHLAFLAWRQLTRRGVVNGSEFDGFVDRLADMSTDNEPESPTEEEAEEPGPATVLSPNGLP